MRRLHLHVLTRGAIAGSLLLIIVLPGCGGDRDVERMNGAGRPDDADAPAAASAADDFIAGFDAADPATAALVAMLEPSIGADLPTDAALAAATCALGRDAVYPTELLAAYEITGRSTRGDTVVVRATVVTAAEQRIDRRQPGRYDGVVRERRGEWEWDVVPTADGWRVCAGPTFGLLAPDALTTWRPDGASRSSARELAARLGSRPAAPRAAPRSAAAADESRQ